MDTDQNNTPLRTDDISVSQHGKDEFPPAHTAEHILNATMVRMLGCSRSRVNHVERKKSKCNYTLASCPDEQQIREIEERVNTVLAQHLPVTCRMVPRAEVPDCIDLSKLPDDAGDELRLVFVGDYDVCPCAGAHVANTSEVGHFRISSTSWNPDAAENNFRIVFRLDLPEG